MKKFIIPILGIVIIAIIFFLTYNKEENNKKIEAEKTQLEKNRLAEIKLKEAEKFCRLKLEDLEGDFNKAKSVVWDDDNELKRIRRDALRLLEKCPTKFLSQISELRARCNKELN